jgi:hypothetical protein
MIVMILTIDKITQHFQYYFYNYTKKISMNYFSRLILTGLTFFVLQCSLFAAEPFRIQGNLSLYRLEPNKVYIVENDIEAPIDKTIDLPAGTVFLFLDDKKFLINGNLSAQGTDSAPVIFSSVNDPGYTQSHDSTLVFPYSWAGIRINETALNVVFQNAVIKYADTPMACHGAGVHLQNVRRIRTKLDGLLFNNDKKQIKQNQPFSFQSILPSTMSAVDTTNLHAKEPAPIIAPVVTPEAHFWKKRVFRWTLGGAGGVAVCAGAAFFINAAAKNNQSKDDLEKSTYYAKLRQFPESREAYSSAVDNANKRDKSTKAGTISSIIGAFFLCGFGLTFMF